MSRRTLRVFVLEEQAQKVRCRPQHRISPRCRIGTQIAKKPRTDDQSQPPFYIHTFLCLITTGVCQVQATFAASCWWGGALEISLQHLTLHDYNLIAMASNPSAMASNLIAMTSNLIAMASHDCLLTFKGNFRENLSHRSPISHRTHKQHLSLVRSGECRSLPGGARPTHPRSTPNVKVHTVHTHHVFFFSLPCHSAFVHGVWMCKDFVSQPIGCNLL